MNPFNFVLNIMEKDKQFSSGSAFSIEPKVTKSLEGLSLAFNRKIEFLREWIAKGDKKQGTFREKSSLRGVRTNPLLMPHSAITQAGKGKYVSKDRLAEAFSVSLRTVERWMTYGCPYYKISGSRGGRTVRFDLEEVDAWILSQQKGGI